MSRQKRKYVTDRDAMVNFVTESDTEIDLGEGFPDSDDSDWEYKEERIANHQPAPTTNY